MQEVVEVGKVRLFWQRVALISIVVPPVFCGIGTWPVHCTFPALPRTRYRKTRHNSYSVLRLLTQELCRVINIYSYLNHLRVD